MLLDCKIEKLFMNIQKNGASIFKTRRFIIQEILSIISLRSISCSLRSGA